MAMPDVDETSPWVDEPPGAPAPAPPEDMPPAEVEAPARPNIPRPTAVTFTCSHCGTSEDRVMADRPTAFAEVLQGVREEIRALALFDSPAAGHEEPPWDRESELSLAAAAVVGLRWDGDEIVERRHFHQPFWGWTWEMCRAEPAGRPDLARVARRFHAAHLGHASDIEIELRKLANPYLVARCDAETVRRVLDLAWQREMLYDALSIAGLLRQDMGVDVADLRERMKILRRRLEEGRGA